MAIKELCAGNGKVVQSFYRNDKYLILMKNVEQSNDEGGQRLTKENARKAEAGASTS